MNRQSQLQPPMTESHRNDDSSTPTGVQKPGTETEAIDWLIIGGGIHGVHVAARLIGEGGLDPSRLQILDPGPRLLARWRSCTEATGMSHLRSPGVHHLDLEPFSLARLAGPRRRRPRGLMKAPYDRPSLALFNTHCDQVIERFGLADRHLRGHARVCQVEDEGVSVTTCGGERIEARRVVLAIGAGDQPYWPGWAPRHERRVQHIFSRDFRWPDESYRSFVVVGGGISAAQVALRLLAEGRRVDLLIRHELRVHSFDSDPGWLGPKLFPEFQRLEHPDDRRRLIQEVRNRGSITPELHRKLKHAADLDDLRIHRVSISSAQVEENRVRLETAHQDILNADHLLLATGFDGRRPGGEWLDRLVESVELPCATCGYPVVDPLLRWHPRIHVTGPLAELELGPVSRNIAGARRAGDRLVQALRQSEASSMR